jgi:MYXO-CTERM domain-containing protein
VFTFESAETPVTFECSLDGGTWATCPATYNTPFLSNGLHTLGVRAVDPAGNVDGTPATYIWEIAAVWLDGGTLDAGETEAGGIDGGLVVIDAETLDTEKRDVPADLPPRRDVIPDVPTVVVDVGASEARAEVPAILAEAGGETYAAPEARRDTQQPSGPEPSPDSAVVPRPEPSPDTAPPVVKDDAAVNDDAAEPQPVVPEVKVLGGGFCAISSSPSAPPAGFALLALAGLALLRRRRSR